MENEGNRTLLTVLFTDIVGSTSRASEMGDGVWLEVLDHHDAIVRHEILEHGGREVGNVGDGFVATFISPTDAIFCARAVVTAVHALDLQLRVGVHTGEVEQRDGGDVAGIGVHVAARISSLAKPDEVLVSTTVRDLVAGSGLTFNSRGLHVLKGVPGKRALFAVGTVDGQAKSLRRKGTRAAEQPGGNIRVLLVDDHPLWRETLRGLLESRGTATVCAEAGNGEDAVLAVAEHRPDLVLMDIDMPRLDGIGATEQITRASPGTKVLILSSLTERGEVLAAVRAGARGYLLKTADSSEVADAIRRVQAGEVAFPAEFTALVLTALAGGDVTLRPSGLLGLSDQETTILKLVADGLSNAAIAHELHVSPKTVEAHLNSIFTKLRLTSTVATNRRVQAAAVFLQANPRSRRDNP